jgi:hypothetical protein
LEVPIYTFVFERATIFQIMACEVSWCCVGARGWQQDEWRGRFLFGDRQINLDEVVASFHDGQDSDGIFTRFS